MRSKSDGGRWFRGGAFALILAVAIWNSSASAQDLSKQQVEQKRIPTSQSDPKARFESREGGQALLWTKGDAKAFNVGAFTTSFRSPGGFAPVKAIAIEWKRKDRDEAEGTGLVEVGTLTRDPVAYAAHVIPDVTSKVEFRVVLPKEGKAAVELLSLKGPLVLSKEVILGMYDLSRASGDPATTQLLAGPARAAHHWDAALYSWQPDYVQVSLVKADDPKTPFRVYAVADTPTHETKRKLDEYFLVYYWLAASRATTDPLAKETLNTLAKRVIPPRAIRDFLDLY